LYIFDSRDLLTLASRLTPDPFPYSYYNAYLNLPETQAAIGAYQNFSTSSTAVGQAFAVTGDDNREAGTIEALRKLLDQGIYVVLFAGDADYKYAPRPFYSTHTNRPLAATGSAAK
jgi:hypothetical protein